MAATIGSVLCVILGAIGLVRPMVLAEQTGFTTPGPLGMTEHRALFGGVFLALGAACLVLQQPPVYLTAGVAFLGAVAAKVVGAVVDRPPLGELMPGLLFDLVVGVLLVSGS